MKPRPLQLSDLKVGDEFNVQMQEILGTFGIAKCIGNEPEKRRIFISINWRDGDKRWVEKYIKFYDDDIFKNFSLINQELYDAYEDDDKVVVDDAIVTLKKQLEDKVKNEKYEEANDIIKKVKCVILSENSKENGK